MRTKSVLTCCCCSIALFAISLWGASPKGVILVMIDDIGYGDINVLEPSTLKTPQLDQMHSESVRFTDFHVGTTCAPTRGSLMTGRCVNAGGVFHTIVGRDRLLEGEQTMAEVFKANGWATGIFGKWHLGNGYPYEPQYRGFDLAVVHRGGGVGQQPDYWGNDYYSKVKYDGSPAVADVYFENGKEIKADEFCTDYWFKRAKAFIKTAAKKDQRFFCYIPTNAAHSPCNAPQGGKPGFDGLIENIDVNMAQLEAFLVAEGLKDDVLLIFTTDNGTAGDVRVGGLRGKKGSHYDGGHNVPCFWRWKNGGIGGSQEQARDVNSLTAIADFLPTFIDMFDLIKPAGGKPLHGISLKEMALNPAYTPQPRTWVVDTQRDAHLVKWKKASVLQDVVVDGKITRKWRLMRDKEGGKFEVYDFAGDRSQRADLTAVQAELSEAVIKELSGVYEAWWKDISSGQEQFPPSVLGVAEEDILYSHDWCGQGMSPWNQGQVLAAGQGSRVSPVRFEKPGRYRFELRRWPREEGSAIVASDKSGKGKALKSIVTAQLDIRGVGGWSKLVQVSDTCVVFEGDIKIEGQTELTSAFQDAAGKVVCGAYYIYVKRMLSPGG